jgi:hypothetical protein
MPKYPPSANRRGSTIAQQMRQKHGNFDSFFILLHFSLYSLKIKDTFEKFDKLRVAPLLIIFYCIITTFSQTQTGVTVPLRKFRAENPI